MCSVNAHSGSDGFLPIYINKLCLRFLLPSSPFPLFLLFFNFTRFLLYTLNCSFARPWFRAFFFSSIVCFCFGFALLFCFPFLLLCLHSPLLISFSLSHFPEYSCCHWFPNFSLVCLFTFSSFAATIVFMRASFYLFTQVHIVIYIYIYIKHLPCFLSTASPPTANTLFTQCFG